MLRWLSSILRGNRHLPVPAASSLPPDWRSRVEQAVLHVRLLDRDQRELYLQRVEQFLENKTFVGCAGLEVTDDMRIAVAGLGCLMILRPQAQVFPRLRSVLMYPDAFLVPSVVGEDGLVSEEPQERVGESWGGDRVILSWPDVEAALAGDAVNVVVHEFAHQLDDHKAGAEGAPATVNPQRWAEVMRAEFERLQRHRRPPVLDPYGAESPAEFFAVATESFFQRGQDLLQHHAELYALLRDYYRIETSRLSF
jgi:MtfA peptidase